MKPYLALFRGGPSSLHPHAVERLSAQSFDYALSWFGDEAPDAPGAAFVHMQKGAKWPGLEQTLIAHRDAISQYRYVWLPDDDLLCVPEKVSLMFSMCDELQLDLAQPALTLDSYFTHTITMQHQAFQLRFTNFVEIMAPILSAPMLERIFPTLAGNISGYGLDGLWPHYTKLGNIAIIDDTPVKHTRPVGGPNYLFSQKAGIPPVHEDWLVSATYGIERPANFQVNYGGLLQDGTPIAIGDSEYEIDHMLRMLIESCSKIALTSVQFTRYLSNHLAYWHGGGPGQRRYPRNALRVVLNHSFRHLGFQFPEAPTVPMSETAAAVQGKAS
jgi:hypothetical protein